VFDQQMQALTRCPTLLNQHEVTRHLQTSIQCVLSRQHQSHNNNAQIHCRTPYRIGLCSVLRPRQHSIGYMGDGFYRSKDPTNSIKVLKEDLQRKIRQRKQQNTHMHRQ